MSSVRSVLVTRPFMRFRPSGVVDTSNLNEFNDSRIRHLPAPSVSSKRGQTVLSLAVQCRILLVSCCFELIKFNLLSCFIGLTRYGSPPEHTSRACGVVRVLLSLLIFLQTVEGRKSYIEEVTSCNAIIGPVRWQG